MLFAYLLALCCIILFSACSQKYTPQEAIKDLNKANDYQPNTTKIWVNEKHPCFTDTKTDSSAYLSAKKEADSLLNLYNQQLLKLPEIVYLTEKDTTECIEECNKRIAALKDNITLKESTIYSLNKQVKKLINSPVHDTVIDNRKLNAKQAQFEELQKAFTDLSNKYTSLQSDYEDMKHKKNWWRKWCLITWAIIGLTIGARLYFKKPF